MDFFELDIGKIYIQEAKQNSWGMLARKYRSLYIERNSKEEAIIRILCSMVLNDGVM